MRNKWYEGLFIIGNGFDLAHGLKTSYEDFHKYLQDKYPDSNGEGFVQPEVITMLRGEATCDDIDTVSFLFRIIASTSDDEWKDIENQLGSLDFSEWFTVDYELDEDGNIDMPKQTHTNEDIATNIGLQLQEYQSFLLNGLIQLKLMMK